MPKVVINTCHGGFGLSREAIEQWAEIKGIKLFFDESESNSLISHYYTDPAKQEDQYFSPYSEIYEDRQDEALIQVVETLKDRVNGAFAELKIVEIPDGIEWKIEDYDGVEWVAEKHRTWS